jgi:hypothetical protein
MCLYVCEHVCVCVVTSVACRNSLAFINMWPLHTHIRAPVHANMMHTLCHIVNQRMNIKSQLEYSWQHKAHMNSLCKKCDCSNIKKIAGIRT